MRELTRDRLAALTGYKQPSRQAQWLQRELGLVCPRRASDGLPLVTEAQVEAALMGKRGAANGPKWSRVA